MSGNTKSVLLVTRPSEGARKLVEQLHAVAPETIGSLSICVSPLMQIAYLNAPVEIGDARTLIFTSQHGVSAADRAQVSRSVPCHCVGQATASRARASGWAVLSVSENAEQLLDRLRAKPGDAPLLHIAGRTRRGHIASNLNRAGVKTTEHVAYDQVLMPLSDQALSVLDGSLPVIAPLFSPRSARHFAREHRGSAPIWVAALSQAVAEALETLPLAGLEVAGRPDLEHMIVVVQALADRVTRVEGRPGGE